MNTRDSTKQKHLDLNARIEIQECLGKGMTFKDIAKRIGKDPTTVSKEIKKHLVVKESPVHSYNYRGKPILPCKFLMRAPFVCNGCERARKSCSHQKQFYYAKKAQQEYEFERTDSRLGIPLNHEEFYEIDKIIHEKVKQGQRLYHIMDWVEMDTVIGKIGGKTIVTFDFTFCNFMFGLLVPDKTASETAKQIETLKANLSAKGYSFGEVFPLILTDNGGEFANIWAFENNSDGCKETNLFFCDPYCSSQKPRVEKNHTLFRDIVPKGTSFDSFTQETVNLIFSHVNSVKRKSLNGKSPFEVFAFTYGEKLAQTLGVSFVEPQTVIQSPKLLKK